MHNTGAGAQRRQQRQTLHRHCVALIAEAQAARDAINQTLSAPRGLVRLSCPTGLLQGGVADILGQYLATHPEARKIVFAALWTEMCLAMPAIQPMGDGYDVYVLTDASGGVSEGPMKYRGY